MIIPSQTHTFYQFSVSYHLFYVFYSSQIYLLSQIILPPPPIQGHSSSSKSQLSSSFSDKHMNSSIANLESMVDWYLMGEAPLSICTGSSFCLSARARTGLGRSTWKMDADTDSSVIAGEGHTNTITCPNKYGEIFNYLHRPPYNRSLHVPNLPLPWFYKAMFHYAQ